MPSCCSICSTAALRAPRGVPVVLLAATEAATTTILTLEGCPIFWRTCPLARPGEVGYPIARRAALLRDVAEALDFAGDELGVAPPARLLVTGPLAEEEGLAGWLAAQLVLLVDTLDASCLVRQATRRVPGEGWNWWGVALGAATR